jgi:hypothetical protein
LQILRSKFSESADANKFYKEMKAIKMIQNGGSTDDETKVETLDQVLLRKHAE